MKKSIKISFIFTAILTTLFITFTILVKYINVEAIGPENTKVGLALINDVSYELFGKNNMCDKLSNIVLVLVFTLPLIFSIIGIYQLVKRKSLKLVDKELYILLGTYILTAIVFILFELIHINYRPVLIDGELEQSYPSTHILISTILLLTTIILSKKYIHKKRLRKILTFGLELLLIASIILRILSGMHWITDIIGALILGFSISTLFNSVILIIKSKQEKL